MKILQLSTLRLKCEEKSNLGNQETAKDSLKTAGDHQMKRDLYGFEMRVTRGKIAYEIVLCV